MWREAPGVLHRHVKGVQAPRDEHTDDKGSTFATPSKIIDRRADSWEQTWNDRHTTEPALIAGLEVVLAKAKEEDVDPISPDQIENAIASMCGK